MLQGFDGNCQFLMIVPLVVEAQAVERPPPGTCCGWIAWWKFLATALAMACFLSPVPVRVREQLFSPHGWQPHPLIYFCKSNQFDQIGLFQRLFKFRCRWLRAMLLFIVSFCGSWPSAFKFCVLFCRITNRLPFARTSFLVGCKILFFQAPNSSAVLTRQMWNVF